MIFHGDGVALRLLLLFLPLLLLCLSVSFSGRSVFMCVCACAHHVSRVPIFLQDFLAAAPAHLSTLVSLQKKIDAVVRSKQVAVQDNAYRTAPVRLAAAGV